MIKNVIVLSLFIIYSIYLPLLVGVNIRFDPYDLHLLFFDLVFIFDRFTDLFVEYVNKNGIPEPLIFKVIMQNLSYSIFLELILTIIPIIIMDEKNEINTILYLIIKFPRIMMMFESTN